MFKTETLIRVRVKFQADFAYLAANTPAMWESLEAQPDGSVIAAMSMPDLVMACVFVMSYGPAVTVIEPEELRHMVREWAAAMVAQYNGG